MKFDQRAFEKLTPQCRGKVVYQDVVESTNDEARKEIISGEGSSGNLYIAEFQTKGRGRGGNRWVCPAGEGLLFSLIVDPDVSPMLWYRMSLAVGLAIVDVLRDLGLEPKLKWPNDIYINDKKVGGILIEKVNDLLIVGVGLNVNVREFPGEVAERATSLSARLGENVNREVLLSEIVCSIYKNGSMIGESFGRLIERVMECFYLKNEQVRMIVNREIVVGEVRGVTENGYLMVEKDGGLIEIIQASEIKIIRLS
ncbi:MAG: BirA family biotin operon repressor/biotin-[acetyl-CoA-carboxylase] ligase [Cryomorphaceae bacterium]|jgi:BirA family biotin operon repressor/biotin-[acetyl-CoA-carboxylase] ligase